MQKSVIIVGAGIIGAAVAYRLARAGAQVTVVDAGQAGATGASFGWINASFFLHEDHYRLRVEGIAAWRRLEEDLQLPITWCGSLCWEEGRLETRQDALRALGYDAALIDTKTFARMEPHVGTPPAQSLHFPQEGVAEPIAVAAAVLTAAQEAGAQVVRGVEVTGFERQGLRVVGVQTGAGVLRSDQVLLAAGVGCKRLMAMLDHDLPMLHRPALVIKTAPVARVLNHILVSDIGEVRQLPCGALVMPVAPGHQGDDSDSVGNMEAEAQSALTRLQALVPQVELRLAETMLAERPMPGDGLPAVGPVAEGAYLTVMHSGITLAAVMGELVCDELLQGETNHSAAWLAPYRPGRFWGTQGTDHER
ncbi:MAG: FAD-dependent oxidoreductase [Pseudomonadota bacterium]